MTAELELLNRLKQEFGQHPVDLLPERCYSPATLAKAYFSAMGIKPPQQKFKIPDKINGIAVQAFSAGRAECLIRRTPVPVTYVDFHAQFPAVSKSAQLPGNIVRREFGVCRLHSGGAGDGGTRNPG